MGVERERTQVGVIITPARASVTGTGNLRSTSPVSARERVGLHEFDATPAPALEHLETARAGSHAVSGGLQRGDEVAADVAARAEDEAQRLRRGPHCGP